MSQSRLEGVIAPVLTPFAEDGAPDTDRFVEHAQWLLDDGCHGLAPFGTTSEANSIGLDERMELLEELVDAGVEAEILIPGTGTCSVADTVMLTQHAMDLDCAGVLMLPPFYYKEPSDSGVFRFFAEVIEETADNDLAVYLYHIPQISGFGFSLDLVKRLKTEFPDNIVGLKDSSGDWSNMKSILDEIRDFDLFVGSEMLLLKGLQNGAVGTIAAGANLNASAIRKLYDGFDTDEADNLQECVTAFRKSLSGYHPIPALKGLLAHFRKDGAWLDVRPPFEALDRTEASKLAAQLAEAVDFHPKFDIST